MIQFKKDLFFIQSIFMWHKFFLYISFSIFSLNGFFFSKKKEKEYDVHFHLYDARMSKLITEKLQQKIINKRDDFDSSFADRAKTFLFRAGSCLIICCVLYYQYNLFLVRQKIRFLLKEIIRDSDYIRDLLINQESYFSTLPNYSFYQKCTSLIFGSFNQQNQGESERKRITQEIFQAIKKDFRFQELSALMYTHSISKSRVLEWIEDILINNYVFI